MAKRDPSSHTDWRRPGGSPIPPVRSPRHGFGVVLKHPSGFKGGVDAIYGDYYAAVTSFAVPPGWFDAQTFKPVTRDQVYYPIVALNGEGAALVGEHEAVRA